MKRKQNYRRPALWVVELQVRNQLLSGSNASGGFSGDPEEEDME